MVTVHLAAEQTYRMMSDWACLSPLVGSCLRRDTTTAATILSKSLSDEALIMCNRVGPSGALEEACAGAARQASTQDRAGAVGAARSREPPDPAEAAGSRVCETKKWRQANRNTFLNPPRWTADSIRHGPCGQEIVIKADKDSLILMSCSCRITTLTVV